MSRTLGRLINFYLIELLLIFRSEKVLLKIIIHISLVSSWLHRLRILKGMMVELLTHLSRSLLHIIMMCINTTLQTNISVVCNFKGVLKHHITLIIQILRRI
jgi:hypothetical protein